MPIIRENVLLNYQTKVAKREKNEQTGKLTRSGNASVIVRGNVIIKIPKPVVERFNIPVYEAASTPSAPSNTIAAYKRREYTRAFYASIEKDEAQQIAVDDGFFLVGTSEGAVFSKSIRIPSGKKTAKGNLRYFSIGFPSFFNLIMIAQAVGSMIKATDNDKRPDWFISKSGVRYKIPYNSATAPLNYGNNQPLPHGAWVSQSLIAPQNLDNPGDAINEAIESGTSKGGNAKKASA